MIGFGCYSSFVSVILDIWFNILFSNIILILILNSTQF